MWDRATLKETAKAKLSSNYWPIILVSFIFMLVSGSGGDSSSSDSTYENLPPEMAAMVALIVLIILLVSIILGIFVFYPLSIGCRRYFLNLETGNATFSDMTCAFRENYWNVVKIGVLHNVYVFLWLLCLVIPGIIKGFAYRMVPYLLAEDTSIPSSEIFRRSSEMMDGSKLDSFILDLSFIGWAILCVFTLGILAIFYVNPYIYLTETELYLALSGSNRRTGYGNTYSNSTNAYSGYADIYKNAYGNQDNNNTTLN